MIIKELVVTVIAAKSSATVVEKIGFARSVVSLTAKVLPLNPTTLNEAYIIM